MVGLYKLYHLDRHFKGFERGKKMRQVNYVH